MKEHGIRWALLGTAMLAAAAPAAADPGGRREPARDAISLRVAVLDGINGAPLRGAAVSFSRGGEKPRPLSPVGDAFLLADTGFERGQEASHRLDVVLPDGWVRVEESRERPPVVTRFTKALERTVVAWPEARILVEVVDPEGRPVAGAPLSAYTEQSPFDAAWATAEPSNQITIRGGPEYLGRGTTGPDGLGRLRGAPAIQGVEYRVSSFHHDQLSEPFRIDDPAAEHRVRLQVVVDGTISGSGSFAFGIG